MKTSELIGKIGKQKLLIYKKEDSGEVNYIRVFTEKVLDSESKYVAEIGCVGQWLSLGNDCPRELAELLFSYYCTPLEEREEEKKYYLKSIIPNGFNEKMYIVNGLIAIGKRGYFLSSMGRQKFTQKEIDAMPFDTNFFIKEEVSEK